MQYERTRVVCLPLLAINSFCVDLLAASHEKGPSDISHSVDQDQPLYDVGSTYK